MKVTPYEVSGKIDYDRVVKEFGASLIEGRLKKHICLGDNYHDVILMSLFKDSYYANHQLSFFKEIS